ncbi:MAG: hypothetical protein ACLUNO_12495 [Oscillospiraceae bacterium]
MAGDEPLCRRARLIKKDNPFPAVCGRHLRKVLRGCLHPRHRRQSRWPSTRSRSLSPSRT